MLPDCTLPCDSRGTPSGVPARDFDACPPRASALSLALLLAVVALAAGCRQAGHAHDEESEGAGHETIAAESRVQRRPDGAVVVTLDAATQQRLGLVIAPPTPGRLPRELRAYGRVLDPAPLIALHVELVTAQTALEASTKEFQRLKLLFEQGENASRRALEAAEAAMQRDRVATESARWKLLAAWGQAVAAQPDLAAFVKSLAAQDSVLVRLDLPAGETAVTPAGARLLVLANPGQPIAAQCLGPAADVDSQAQGQGYLFLAPGGSGLRPGQAVVGYLAQPGEPLAGVLVPVSAVIRAAGQAWVYLEESGQDFSRRAIGLEHPVEGGWLVTRGLTAQDRLVVTGAQVLFSEELKSRLQVGD